MSCSDVRIAHGPVHCTRPYLPLGTLHHSVIERTNEARYLRLRAQPARSDPAAVSRGIAPAHPSPVRRATPICRAPTDADDRRHMSGGRGPAPYRPPRLQSGEMPEFTETQLTSRRSRTEPRHKPLTVSYLPLLFERTGQNELR